MKTISKQIIQVLIILIIILFTYIFVVYPNNYPSKKAIANNNVVFAADGIYNLDLLNNFVEKSNAGIETSIRVVVYSKEGYPQIFDIMYSNNKYICRNDNTRNIYGRTFLVTEEVYESIEIDESMNYYLIKNDGNSILFFQAK